MEIKVLKIRLDLKNPFRIAHGSYAYRESILVWLRVGGAFGMGEAPIVPYYGVSADEVEEDLRRGLRSWSAEAALSDPGFPSGDFAYPVSRCAFQTAVLSLRGRLEGIGLPEVLGFYGERKTPPSSFTVAYDDDPEEMVRVAAASGFRHLKVKAGIPGDIERLRLLRERLPHATIRVDANQGWSMEEAPGKLAELERIGVELVEEPVAGGPADFERLASSTSLPILLDESAKDLEQVRRFGREAPSVAGIVVKTAKNGGPCASALLARAAVDSGLRVMVSCMVETSLGVSAALALAPLCAWCDLDAPLLLSEDPFSGLTYEEEVPRVGPSGVVPGPALAEHIEGLPPLQGEAR